MIPDDVGYLVNTDTTFSYIYLSLHWRTATQNLGIELFKKIVSLSTRGG